MKNTYKNGYLDCIKTIISEVSNNMKDKSIVTKEMLISNLIELSCVKEVELDEIEFDE